MLRNISVILRPSVRWFCRNNVKSESTKITVTNTWIQSKKQSSLFQPPAFYDVRVVRKSFYSTQCDEKKVEIAEFEEINDLINHPEKILIDVREPDELKEFGQIPTSINIPLAEVKNALCLSADEFREYFGRTKPSSTTEIIFSCKSGKRANVAAEVALKLGLDNVKNYAGSWNDWATHKNLPK